MSPETLLGELEPGEPIKGVRENTGTPFGSCEPFDIMNVQDRMQFHFFIIIIFFFPNPQLSHGERELQGVVELLLSVSL